MSSTRIPLNFFGMGFGLAGLATAWRIAVELDLASHWISDTLTVVATLVWATSCLLYLRYALTTPGALLYVVISALLAHRLSDVIGLSGRQLLAAVRA